LTIDDAPTTRLGEKLDLLESLKIPALFFSTGKSLKKFYTIALEALERGFPVGNHTFSHEGASRLSIDQFYGEVARTDELLERLYADAKKKPVKAFRFPYGDRGWGNFPENLVCPPERTQHAADLQQILQKMGYAQPRFTGSFDERFNSDSILNGADTLWTFDYTEYNYDEKSYPLSVILDRTERSDPENWLTLNAPEYSQIILTHDHDHSSDLFEHLIRTLAAKDFLFRLPEF